MRASLHRRHAGMLFLLVAATVTAPVAAGDGPAWTAAQRRQIATLSLSQLPPPPPSPGNRVADLPAARVLGQALFMDAGLSRNGRIACATCHLPERQFTDGRRLGQGMAGLPRHVPGLLAAAWSPWQFWDGRADSLWAQAVQPLRDAREQGLSPERLLQRLRQQHASAWQAVFGPLPARLADATAGTTLFVNTGKAIEAYERSLRPPRTRFDDYADALAAGQPSTALDAGEQRGLQVFLGKGQCGRCHFGPLFTNHGFSNTGLGSRPAGQPDPGREQGLARVMDDPLRCGGDWHDARPASCPHLAHVRLHAPEWLGAYKVPSLRQVAQTAPYMHDGRFGSLEQVVTHYQHAQNPDGDFGHTELRPLALSAREQTDLVNFLKTL